mmetsp:Transcript_11627/g.17625  ORF Transcript_11627/g.17625 Transcript_11627/m.17625 type:complete len:522 (-) Transcript_11627:109-1674(-)
MDGIEDESRGWHSVTHTLELVDISRSDRVHSFFSSLEEGQCDLQILICLILFFHDLVLLFDTVLGDDSDFIGLFLGFLVLNFELLEQLVSDFRGLLEFDLFLSEVDLELFNTLGSLSQSVESLDDVGLFSVDSIVLLLVDVLVQVDERQVTLWRHIHMTTHSLEVQRADIGHEVMAFTHVVLQALSDLISGVHAEALQELLGHTHQSIFGPREEPIDGALGEQGGELLGSLSELVADGGEGEDHVQAILHSVDEEGPEVEQRRLNSLHSNFLHVDVLGLQGEHVLLVLGDQTRDFSGSEHTVDGLEEGLALDFGVGHDEGDLLAQRTGFAVEVLDVVLQVVIVVRLGQRDLEEDVLHDEGSQLGQRLLSRSSDTDQKDVSTGGVDDSGDSQQMLEGIVEDDEVHGLRGVLLVISLKLLIGNLSDRLDVGASLVHEGGFLFELSVLVVLVFSLEVGEQVAGHQLLIFEAELVSELLLGDSVEHVLECLLVSVTDELVNERTLGLVAPKGDEEEFGSDLLLDV